jgi:Big-like domain-containing protein
MLSKKSRLGAVSLLIFSGALSGCTLNTDVSAPGGLINVSGDNQTAAPNTPLPTPLTVMVVTQFGARITNATVNWTIDAGGGTLSASSVLTDESGMATVNYTTGPTVGLASVRAQVHGVPPLTFHITIS